MRGECRRTTDLPYQVFSSPAFLPEASTLNLRFSFSCVSCFSPSSQFLESPRPSNSHSILISLPIASSLPLCLSPSVCFPKPCLSFSDFSCLSLHSLLPSPFLFSSLLFTVLAFVSLSFFIHLYLHLLSISPFLCLLISLTVFVCLSLPHFLCLSFSVPPKSKSSYPWTG